MLALLHVLIAQGDDGEGEEAGEGEDEGEEAGEGGVEVSLQPGAQPPGALPVSHVSATAVSCLSSSAA